MSLRNPGKKSPMDGCCEEVCDKARVDEMLCRKRGCDDLMGSRGENVTCTRTSFRAVRGEEHGKVGLIG